MNSPKHVDDETPAAFLDGRDDSDAESDSSDGRDDSDAESDSTDDDPYCYGCSRQFVDMAALNQHLLDSAKHNWCFECSRDFGSENALLNVSHVCNSSSIPDPRIVSIKTLLPIASAISHAPSANKGSRVLPESLYISNPDATRKSLATTSLPRSKPWISFPTSPSNALRDPSLLQPCVPTSPQWLLSTAQRMNATSVVRHSELFRALMDI